MRISCDIDGVVGDAMGEWLKQANRLHGTRYRHKDLTEWDLGAALGFTDDEVSAVWHRMEWDMVMPIPGAVEVLTDREVVFITSRNPDIDSVGWLSRWFPDPEVHHAKGGTKMAKATELGVQCHIEDRPTEIAVFDAEGFPCIAMDQPWNRNSDARFRCGDWGAVDKKLALWESFHYLVGPASRLRKPL
jgi:5'(3')-deoxyribonucleotidase